MLYFTGCRSSTEVWPLVENLAGGPFWHNTAQKLVTLFQQKLMFPAKRALESYWSRFESVWMTLADSTALKDRLSAQFGLQHHTMAYIAFQNYSRSTRHCVGFALRYRLYLAQSYSSWCDLGAELSCTKAPCFGLLSGSQSFQGTGEHMAKSNCA